MQLGPCISELKLPGRLLNHSEAIKLNQGSLAMAETGPELATNGSGCGSQGSSARGEGSVTAQSRLRQDDCGSEQGTGAQVAKASLGGQGTAGTQGTAGRGENVNGILTNPLPCLYRKSMGSRRVFPPIFRYT